MKFGLSDEIFEKVLELVNKNNKDKLFRIVYTLESNDGINYYFKVFTNNK